MLILNQGWCYMNMKLFLLVAGLCSLVSCGDEVCQVDSARLIDTKSNGNCYTVLYVNKNCLSPEEARCEALKRAAEVTVRHGYRYFVVDSETMVTIAVTDKQGPTNNNGFYDNMYQEMIVEGDFGRRSIEARTTPPAQFYPAYKVVFHCICEERRGKGCKATEYKECQPKCQSECSN